MPAQIQSLFPTPQGMGAQGGMMPRPPGSMSPATGNRSEGGGLKMAFLAPLLSAGFGGAIGALGGKGFKAGAKAGLGIAGGFMQGQMQRQIYEEARDKDARDYELSQRRVALEEGELHEQMRRQNDLDVNTAISAYEDAIVDGDVKKIESSLKRVVRYVNIGHARGFISKEKLHQFAGIEAPDIQQRIINSNRQDRLDTLTTRMFEGPKSPFDIHSLVDSWNNLTPEDKKFMQERDPGQLKTLNALNTRNEEASSRLVAGTEYESFKKLMTLVNDPESPFNIQGGKTKLPGDAEAMYRGQRYWMNMINRVPLSPDNVKLLRDAVRSRTHKTAAASIFAQLKGLTRPGSYRREDREHIDLTTDLYSELFQLSGTPEERAKLSARKIVETFVSNDVEKFDTELLRIYSAMTSQGLGADVSKLRTGIKELRDSFFPGGHTQSQAISLENRYPRVTDIFRGSDDWKLFTTSLGSFMPTTAGAMNEEKRADIKQLYDHGVGMILADRQFHSGQVPPDAIADFNAFAKAWDFPEIAQGAGAPVVPPVAPPVTTTPDTTMSGGPNALSILPQRRGTGGNPAVPPVGTTGPPSPQPPTGMYGRPGPQIDLNPVFDRLLSVIGQGAEQRKAREILDGVEAGSITPQAAREELLRIAPGKEALIDQDIQSRMGGRQ